MGLIAHFTAAQGALLQTFRADEANPDVLTIAIEEDVEPILEHNKRRLLDFDHANTRKHSSVIAAIVPQSFAMKWLLEDGLWMLNRHHWPKILEKLDSPEYRGLRTSPHRLSHRPIRNYLRGSTAAQPSRHAGLRRLVFPREG